MPSNDLPSRQARYFALSSEIAHIDTAELHARFDAAETRRGWGREHVLEVGREMVFVKRLALSDLELEQQFSTRNLYGLPTYYNYGVGSAGFGAFRELLSNIKTTNWVLSGAVNQFPLLYHYRVLPVVGKRPPVDEPQLQAYVEYWNGTEQVGRRMRDRLTARHELALFLEYIPHALEPWLLEHPARITDVLDDLRAAVSFLRAHGIVHFDANFNNTITDGERFYLTDFGLALDRRFALTPAERSFLKQNSYYDYAQLLGSIDWPLYHRFKSLPDEEKQRIRGKYGIAEGLHPGAQTALLLDHVERVLAEDIPLDPTYAATLIKYHRITQLYLNFYVSMRENPRKDTVFPNQSFGRMLNATGFLTERSPL